MLTRAFPGGNHQLHARALWAVAVALGLLSLGIAGLPPASGASSECGPVLHGPILVRSDSDFTAANGVVGGSGTASDPFVIGNVRLASVEPGYGLKVDNSRGRITKHFEIRCVQASLHEAPEAGAAVLWLVGVHTARSIAQVFVNGGEADGIIGVRLDGSSGLVLDDLSLEKVGDDGIQLNGSDHVTIVNSKSKAMGNGLTLRDSHDITIGRPCDLATGAGCTEFTYDDGWGVAVVNSHDVLIQYTINTAEDTGSVLLEGRGTFNVRLENGIAAGTGGICIAGPGGEKEPTGLIVDYVAGVAVINGAHDIVMRGYTVQGNFPFSIRNGGDGMYYNPCLGAFVRLPGKPTPGGGANVDFNFNCYFNQFGFDPAPIKACPNP